MSQVSLKQIYFVITRRCNLFCSHCIRSSGPQLKDRLTVEDFKKACLELVSFSKQALLLISGGEPTLHPDFESIVEVACALFARVNINTNGLRENLLLQVTRRHPNLSVQISLDGDQPHHDQIRGPNTFKRSLHTIQSLAQFGVGVTVATTLGSVNKPCLDNLDQTLETIPFERWTIQREVIYGRAQKLNALPTQEWNELAVHVNQTFKNKSRILMHSMFNFQTLLEKAKNPQAQHASLGPNCGTGTTKIYINPDLTVFPCGCMEELILGDLSFESGQTILERMGKMPIQSSLSSPCRHCPVYALCRGGCPGSSLHTFGSFGVGDPRCPAVQDLLLAS